MDSWKPKYYAFRRWFNTFQHPNHPLTRWARIPTKVDPGPTRVRWPRSLPFQHHLPVGEDHSVAGNSAVAGRLGVPWDTWQVMSRGGRDHEVYLTHDWVDLFTNWKCMLFFLSIHIHMLFVHFRIRKIIYLYQLTHLQYQIQRRIVHSWLLCWFTGWPRNWIGRLVDDSLMFQQVEGIQSPR